MTHNVQQAAQLNVVNDERHNEMFLLLADPLRPPHLKVSSLEGSNIGLFVVYCTASIFAFSSYHSCFIGQNILVHKNSSFASYQTNRIFYYADTHNVITVVYVPPTTHIFPEICRYSLQSSIFFADFNTSSELRQKRIVRLVLDGF